MNREEIEAKFGQAWDTQELQARFEVTGFSYGICVVKDKITNKKGSLDFQHNPRFYHSFKEHN